MAARKSVHCYDSMESRCSLLIVTRVQNLRHIVNDEENDEPDEAFGAAFLYRGRVALSLFLALLF